eukprot:g4092.t1
MAALISQDGRVPEPAAVADPGDTGHFSKVALEFVEGIRPPRPAFLLLLPNDCSHETCSKLAEFVDVAVKSLPHGTVWHGTCGMDQLWDPCQHLDVADYDRLPIMLVWGERMNASWEEYKKNEVKKLKEMANYMQSVIANAGKDWPTVQDL